MILCIDKEVPGSILGFVASFCFLQFRIFPGYVRSECLVLVFHCTLSLFCSVLPSKVFVYSADHRSGDILLLCPCFQFSSIENKTIDNEINDMKGN